jgi:hypothetical protein
MTADRLSASYVFEHILKIPKPGSRELVRLRLHPAQQAIINAWDLLGADGLPVYGELAALWPKRAGKSVTVAGLAITELIGDTSEPDREICILAGGLAQARDVVFEHCKRFVQRAPMLAKRCRVLRTEIVFEETVVDHGTGGRHKEQHIIRSVPTGEAASQHGRDHNLLVVDELHALMNYDALEALARPANRKAPRILYSSYAGLKAQARPGVPAFDLWTRAQRGGDPGLFVSLLDGPHAYDTIPWVTPRYLESQRRQFEMVPAKYTRLFLNQWAGADSGTFLTGQELLDAQDATLIEPTAPAPGALYGVGVDLGLSHDLAGVVMSHSDQDGRLVADVIRYWRGSKAKAVDLPTVEREVLTLARRFHARVDLDQWQGMQMAQQLRRAGIEAHVHTIESSKLDKYATLLKSLFAARMVKVPMHHELLRQLEMLEGAELRRDKVRFTSAPGEFDDLPMALCLSTERHHTWKEKDNEIRLVRSTLGRPRLPEIRSCRAKDLMGDPYRIFDCPLSGAPSGHPGCGKCLAFIAVGEACARHFKETGHNLSIAQMAVKFEPCAVVRDLGWEATNAQLGSWL